MNQTDMYFKQRVQEVVRPMLKGLSKNPPQDTIMHVEAAAIILPGMTNRCLVHIEELCVWRVTCRILHDICEYFNALPAYDMLFAMAVLILDCTAWGQHTVAIVQGSAMIPLAQRTWHSALNMELEAAVILSR